MFVQESSFSVVVFGCNVAHSLLVCVYLYMYYNFPDVNTDVNMCLQLIGELEFLIEDTPPEDITEETIARYREVRRLHCPSFVKIYSA